MTDLVTPITAAAFETARAFIATALVAHRPDLDVTPGSAIDGLLIENEAHLAAIHQEALTTLSLTSSLAAITSGQASVSSADVDRLVSNYLITRRPDTAAIGPVRVVVDVAIPYRIPAGFAVTYQSQVFATTQGYRVYQSDAGSVADGTDVRRLSQRADGLYEFTLPMAARVAGTAGQLVAGTTLTLLTPMPGMREAVVATDFAGGSNRETDAELLARAAAGVTAQTLAGGAAHISAALAAQFPGATAGMVGVGSPLMQRDRGNLLGVSTGGKQDLWIRTSAYPRPQTLKLTGTVTNTVAKQVLLTLPPATASGVYRVTGIRPTGFSGLGGYPPAVTQQIAMVDGGPTMPRSVDGAFSAYAALSVVFVDGDGVGVFTLDSQREYDVDVLWMPGITSVNDWAMNPAHRPIGTDTLVRAAVPCRVSVSAVVRVPSSVQPPTAEALANAVSAEINKLPFGETHLSAFVAHRALVALLPSGDVINTRLRGTIHAPTGVDIALPTATELVIPNQPDQLVGPANTFFCCAPWQVEVSIVQR